MMRWPPWPSLVPRKFEVVLVVCKLEGLNLVQFNEEKEKKRLVIEIKWKGQKIIPFGPLRKTVKRNFTEEGGVGGDGVFEWNEEFKSLISLSGSTDGFFLPWEVEFAVFNVSICSICFGYLAFNLITCVVLIVFVEFDHDFEWFDFCLIMDFVFLIFNLVD